MSSKNELQELCQRKGFPIPKYDSIGVPSGPAHRPLFVRIVSVEWEGKHLSEQGEGHSKKDADKKAAENMLLRIGRDQSSSEAKDQGLLTPDPYDQPQLSPSRFKASLQELVQKFNYSIPEYELVSQKGPPHKREFVYKCIVSHNEQSVEKTGSGSTKKAAESNAAYKMLSFIEDYLRCGEFPETVPSPVDQVRHAPKISVKRELALKGFDLSYEEASGEAGVYLCLARASGGQLDIPLAAHGLSMEDKDQAKTQAFDNLKSSLKSLGFIS